MLISRQQTGRMFMLALVWVFMLPIVTWAHTPWANLTAAQKKARDELCADLEANNQFLEMDVDHVGGNCASHSYSRSTPTSNKAERMGKEFREKLIRLSMGIDDDGSDPVVPTCKTPIVCDPNVTFRSADGACNNLNHTDWGMSCIPMRRFLPPQYGNGINDPRTKGKSGQPLPSPRKVSTSLHALDSESTKAPDVTHMTMQFAQFLDHDITHTPIEKGAMGADIECCSPAVAELIANGTNKPRYECFPIEIPDGDEHFTESCMNFVRSVQITNADCEIIAEQMNQITGFVDASQVYGSDKGTEGSLRSHSGGLLRVTGDSVELLSRNPEPDCVTSTEPNYCFKAGDARVDEHMGLASMHTIWMREHNRIARKLAHINYQWNDERIFQETRRIVGAMMQHITYTEWLPVILSRTAINENNLGPSYRYSDSYDPNIDPSIRNAFATAAFRFGHSMIKTNFGERDGDYNNIDDLKLTTLFGNTSIIIQSQGDAVNTITRGLTAEKAQSVDRFMNEEIRDRLFLDAHGNSFDLVALNLQRGRDHGLPGYNAWRKWCGLPEASMYGTWPNTFIDHSKDVMNILSSLYQDPDDIDLFSAGISEKALDDGLLGPTFSCIVARQFRNMKDGDRFWYETNDETLRFTEDQLDELHNVSLARIICDNTDTTQIQPNVFRTVSTSNARINCDDLPSLDLTLWSNDEDMWSDWSKFSDCENGKKTRTRECLSKNNGTIPLECSGEDYQERECRTDCDLSKWSDWGKCVTGCHFRHRTCHCHSCKEGERFESANCEGKTNDKCHEVYHIIRKWYEFGDCGLCH